MGFLILVFISLIVVVVAIASNRRNVARQDEHQCRACGAGHPPFARFCRRCGQKLGE